MDNICDDDPCILYHLDWPKRRQEKKRNRRSERARSSYFVGMGVIAGMDASARKDEYVPSRNPEFARARSKYYGGPLPSKPAPASASNGPQQGSRTSQNSCTDPYHGGFTGKFGYQQVNDHAKGTSQQFLNVSCKRGHDEAGDSRLQDESNQHAASRRVSGNIRQITTPRGRPSGPSSLTDRITQGFRAPARGGAAHNW